MRSRATWRARARNAEQRRREAARVGFAMREGPAFPQRRLGRRQVRGSWKRSTARRLRRRRPVASRVRGDRCQSSAHGDLPSSRARTGGPPFTIGEVAIRGVTQVSEAVGGRSSSRSLRPGSVTTRGRGTHRAWQRIGAERARGSRDRGGTRSSATQRRTCSRRSRFRDRAAAPRGGPSPSAMAPTTARASRPPTATANILDRGFDLQSSVRVSQKQQIGYADVYPAARAHAPCRGSATVPFTTASACWPSTATIENPRAHAFRGSRAIATSCSRIGRDARRASPTRSSVRSRRTAEERIKRALASRSSRSYVAPTSTTSSIRAAAVAAPHVQVAAGAKALASGDDFLNAH
jgi:hypothetical protein